MKPILLLDVDGVLNVFGNRPPGQALEYEFWFELWPIRIPLGTTARLARLAEHYDIVWCTAWEDNAPRVLSKYLGAYLADCPYISWYAGSGPTWKLNDVRVWLEEHGDGRDVAWVDDDLYEDAQYWALGRPDLCLVKTDPARGLTEDVVRVLVSYALSPEREEAAA